MEENLSPTAEAILEDLKTRSPFDYEMVLALKETNGMIKPACEKIGRSLSWYHNKPPEEKAELQRLAMELRLAPLQAALKEAESHAMTAVLTFVELLNARSKNVRLGAAKELAKIVGLYAPEKQVNVSEMHVSRFEDLLAAAYGHDTDELQDSNGTVTDRYIDTDTEEETETETEKINIYTGKNGSR